MRLAVTIAARELRSWFTSPGGWLVLAGFLLLADVMFLAMLVRYATMAHDQVYVPYATVGLDVTDHLVAPWLGNVGFLLLVVVPAVTTRQLAGEARRGTLDLLLTAPVHPAQIVAGKWLGGLGAVAVMLAASAWAPLLLLRWLPVDLAALAVGYGALLLLGGALLGIGLLTSAATDHPATALVVAFAAGLGLWLLGSVDPDPVAWTSQLSLNAHLQDLLRGLVRTLDVAYYALMALGTLTLATVRVDATRDLG